MTNRPKRSLLLAAAISAVLTLPLIAGTAALEQRSSGARWITAWGTSQQSLGTNSITAATVRMIARVTIGGDAVRIRLANTFGTTPLTIRKVYVGQRMQGAAIVPGSNRQVMFKGSDTVSIPPGGTVDSDAVTFKVLARQDLAVSLYIPDADVRPSQHGGAVVTSYLTANGAGDVAADETRAPFTATTTSMLWLKAIDVRSASSTGAIVGFGDSITDGTCSTLDAHDRWQDWLAVRLNLAAEHRGAAAAHKAIVNEGIGGNTVTREHLQPPPDSTPGVERLDRDVLAHHGVTHVVVFMGTNDLRRGASARQVIAGLQDITTRLKARGLKVIGVTIIPRHNVAATVTNSGWNDAKTKNRHEVNEWIRTKRSFDSVIDFDKIVRDPSNADLINGPFNCDGIHPNARGYYEMGNAVSLDLFGR
jgi:lysophospholipase L1-like esterase